jgi:DNA-binding response OmpR family regulator
MTELYDLHDLFYLKSYGSDYATKGNPVVLVVDDNPDTLLLAQSSLWSTQTELVTAKSVEAALEFLKFRTPDVLVTDLMFPDKSGFLLLETLRNSPRLCAVPALVMSGKSNEEYVVRARKLGAAEYLVKPFTPKILRERITSYI